MKLKAIACIHVSDELRTKVVNPGDLFEIDAEEAARLIAVGAAAPSEGVVEAPETDEGDGSDETPRVKNLDDMSKAELKAVAQQYGLTVAPNATAAKILVAIKDHMEAIASAGQIDEESDAEDDEDDTL